MKKSAFTDLTISEFKRFCESKKIERIAYDTDNNHEIPGAENEPIDLLGAALSFDSIRFTYLGGANRIDLLSSAGNIRFRWVSHILVKEYHAWATAYVYCKHRDSEKAYALLIDYTPDK